MMKILVSNDDGVNALGIKTLSRVLSEFAEVVTVAPDRNRSGASHSLTLEVPLRVDKLDETGFYSVKGTPTDCVHWAVNHLLEPDPDLVVAGINHGANLGDDVLYSGTVAAATEGRHMGLPAVAVSLCGDRHFESAAHYAGLLVRALLRAPLASNQILNVNVPDLPLTEIRGIKVTRLGNRHRSEGVLREFDPRGKPIYWIGPPGAKQDAGEGTDFDAVERGFVSITPLTIDMTAHGRMAALNDWIKEVE
jgi:5'-nucleotidase